MPEFGNRGEIEAKIGGIIFSLDAPQLREWRRCPSFTSTSRLRMAARSLLSFYQSEQIAVQHRGLGAVPCHDSGDAARGGVK